MLSEKELENLASLARIELKKNEEKSLLGDLEKILKHFDELKEVKTDDVLAMSGGTLSNNIFREDGVGERIPGKIAVQEFPESKDGFLKIPPVFE